VASAQRRGAPGQTADVQDVAEARASWNQHERNTDRSEVGHSVAPIITVVSLSWHLDAAASIPLRPDQLTLDCHSKGVATGIGWGAPCVNALPRCVVLRAVLQLG